MYMHTCTFSLFHTHVCMCVNSVLVTYFTTFYDNPTLSLSLSFNTFQHSWKIFTHSVWLSVGLSVHALTLVNILQMSWNLYMLFISDAARTLLKILFITIMVCLQWRMEFFWYITAYTVRTFSKRFMKNRVKNWLKKLVP